MSPDIIPVIHRTSWSHDTLDGSVLKDTSTADVSLTAHVDETCFDPDLDVIIPTDEDDIEDELVADEAVAADEEDEEFDDEPEIETEVM